MADINIGAISEALNNKVDLPTNDSQDGIDFVVDWQNPTADNGYKWYRKYKSGWVEQGGTVARGTTATVTLPITFNNAVYDVHMTCYNNVGRYAYLTAITASSFNFNTADDSTDNNDGSWVWCAKGKAA